VQEGLEKGPEYRDNIFRSFDCRSGPEAVVGQLEEGRLPLLHGGRKLFS
jgi:hypothetical protein